jgi:hypothetical protein
MKHRVPETQKLEQAITALTGTAINWWQIAQYPEKISTWKDFRDKFKVRFKPARGAATIDQLFTIFQRGSVEEYRNRFEEIAVELPHVTDDVLESAFLNGLNGTLFFFFFFGKNNDELNYDENENFTYLSARVCGTIEF